MVVAAIGGRVAGYLTLKPEAQSGLFAGQGIPEIVDFNVLIPFRCQGIGTRLLDVAESLVAEPSDVVSLGVGLYPDYGTAQRMKTSGQGRNYVRGYGPTTRPM